MRPLDAHCVCDAAQTVDLVVHLEVDFDRYRAASLPRRQPRWREAMAVREVRLHLAVPLGRTEREHEAPLAVVVAEELVIREGDDHPGARRNVGDAHGEEARLVLFEQGRRTSRRPGRLVGPSRLGAALHDCVDDAVVDPEREPVDRRARR